MVNGAGCVQQNHADDENRQRQPGEGKIPGIPVGFEKQRRGCQDRQNHGDEMGDGAAGIFDVKSGHMVILLKAEFDIVTCSFKNYVSSFYILYTRREKNARKK